ncbi:MAG TPA: nucleotidyltransferase domain-containing protein [Bacillota bacterium]|nr:nucleotidyltransferase domain-containing protein [Bacillota bacterium]
MLLDGQIEKVKDILTTKLSPYFIILFGSSATNRYRKSSDIDLAFLASKSISAYDLFMIGQEIANSLDRDVDLIDLNKASTVMQMEIIYHGKVLYSTDEMKRKEFEMKVFKMYTKLNEERQVVLEAIKESGEIYGK